MGTWGEILQEIALRGPEEGPRVYDIIRRAALNALHEYTGRNAILYATGHLQKPNLASAFPISDEDMEGFMEVVYQLNGGTLDLILHSPGGVAEATDSIVQYLRSKFDDIRVIVPQLAMSAATMITCAADRIVLGKHSKLGPIDPQLVMQTDVGVQMVPAYAILDQFERAKDECTDQQTLAVWYPILRQYGPALLVQCGNAISYSEDRVAEWLTQHMFSGDSEAAEKAQHVAHELNDHRAHKTHGRPLGRDYLRGLGLVIDDLEEDQELQELVLTVFHAFMHTFTGTAALKVIENHTGRSLIRMGQVIPMPAPEAQEKEPVPAQ